MVERDSGPGGIYSLLADVGHGPVRFADEVATRIPTLEEARFLRLTDPSAGLQPVPDGLRCIRGTGRGLRTRHVGWSLAAHL
jgi:hypothetical protein